MFRNIEDPLDALVSIVVISILAILFVLAIGIGIIGITKANKLTKQTPECVNGYTLAYLDGFPTCVPYDDVLELHNRQIEK